MKFKNLKKDNKKRMKEIKCLKVYFYKKERKLTRVKIELTSANIVNL